MSEPTVSVVLVARGEPADRLAVALRAVAAQDYAGHVEVIVATPAEDRACVPPGAVWVDNPGGRRSAGLNRAIAAASGEIICRVDARTRVPTDYVRRCVERLRADDHVGVVGGVQLPIAGSADRVGRGIARALRNPWALGGADYRRLGRSGPTDTVYLGAFRRGDVVDVGGFDEALDANEDFELWQRFRRAGLVVWLEDIAVEYEARARLASVWRQYVAFGRSKVRYWRATGDRPNRRQWLALALAPLAVVLAPLAVVVDHLADPGERDILVRAASLAAYAVIVGGWIYGVVAEALRRSPASARERPWPARPSPGRP